MIRFVIDASVAVKWVVSEAGSTEAATLARADKLLAPDLIAAECANILWKKVRRGDLTTKDARAAADALMRADVQLTPMLHLMSVATTMAIDLNHPAYDYFYIALAQVERCPLVTADEKLARKIAGAPIDELPPTITLGQAAAIIAQS